MAKILDGETLKEFIETYQIHAFSIIIKLDQIHQKASYIIDGNQEFEGNYEVLKAYFEK